MYKGIMTLDDMELRGKTVLCRADLKALVQKEADKLASSVPTIRELSDSGAKVVLLVHQSGEGERGPVSGNGALAQRLASALERPVAFIEDILGPGACEKISSLADGQVLLLDNLAYLSEESAGRTAGAAPDTLADCLLVRKLAPLANLFVNDDFSTVHLRLPSVCGLPQRLPPLAGRLMERELAGLFALTEQPRRPCLFLLAGEKIKEAMQIATAVLDGDIADQVLLGGLVSMVFLWADGYEIGEPSKELVRSCGGEGLVEAADKLLEQHPDRIVLPTDYGYSKSGQRREAMLHVLHKDSLITDIGAGTAQLFRRILLEAGTVFVNGTVGVYEKPESQLGTKLVWQALCETGAHVVLAGDDTAAATRRFGDEKLAAQVSSGGEALIHYLSGHKFRGLKC